MILPIRSPWRAMALVVVLATAATTAMAQASSNASANMSANAPATNSVGPNDVPVGDTARNLLDIQRNGTQAGPMQPLTGDQAARNYARYIQSFNYPLPEYFATQATGSPLRGGVGSAGTTTGQ